MGQIIADDYSDYSDEKRPARITKVSAYKQNDSSVINLSKINVEPKEEKTTLRVIPTKKEAKKDT